MINDYFTAKKVNTDPANLGTQDGMLVVSFNIIVLDKYDNNPNYNISLNNDVGVLKSLLDGWSLQIDVNYNCGYVNTWLYKLGLLTDSDQNHFSSHNIYARELSPTAYSRWVQGKP